MSNNIHFSNNVSVLPFRVKNDQLYLLGQIKDQDLRSVSSSIEDTESPIYTVTRELYARFNIVVESNRLYHVGEVMERGEQWQSTHELFIVDFTSETKEVDDNYIWITPETLSESKDPMLHSMFLKGLDRRLFKKPKDEVKTNAENDNIYQDII